MTILAIVLAGLAGWLHVYIWVMESLIWRKPATWKRFGVATQEEAETQALFAFNQGFYNLFLAIGAFIGAKWAWFDGESPAAWALLVFSCAAMLGAAVVLASCGRQYMRPALLQGTLPALAVVTALIALNA